MNRSAPKRKSWRCDAPAAYYIPALRGGAADTNLACQCPLTHLVTLEVDWYLLRDPN